MIEGRDLLVMIFVTVVLRQVFDTRLDSIVSRTTRLMMHGEKTVPLARALGVKCHFFIIAMSLHVCRCIHEGDDLVDKTLTTHALHFEGVHGPVERDGDTFFQFCICGCDDIGGDEVQRAVDVFLVVFVEDAPGTACRL